MGGTAGTAVARRHRRRMEDLTVAVSRRDAVGPAAQVAERRNRAAVAEVRRALRLRRAAEAAVESADKQAASAVRRLARIGLAQPEIAASCGVPLWTVRRLLRLTEPASSPATD
jgi:DNA-directed RNA polymerase specialized sigma24 family protein